MKLKYNSDAKEYSIESGVIRTILENLGILRRRYVYFIGGKPKAKYIELEMRKLIKKTIRRLLEFFYVD